MAVCPSALTRSVIDNSGVMSPMNPKRYMLCVFRTFRVLSLSLSLDLVLAILCVFFVARVVSETVRGAVDSVLRVLCVLQVGKRNKKEKKEKKKHTPEDESRVNVVKEDKTQERKEEAKAHKKTEQRQEDKKKDPKEKCRRILAEDNAP